MGIWCRWFLLFVGVAGRLALWPLQSWVTRTAVTAPPAASAVAQAVWSVVAIVVLYRLMPIVVASNTQTVRGLLACGAAAIVAPLLALVGNEPRRIIALLGSGATAIGAAIVIHGFQVQVLTFAVAGVACVFAVAPARAGAVLAISAIAGAMRTDDLAEMGDAWRRMRVSALAVLVAALVLGLSAVGAPRLWGELALEPRARAGRSGPADRRRRGADLPRGFARAAAAAARLRTGPRARGSVALPRVAVLARRGRRGPAVRVADSRVARFPRRQEAPDAESGAYALWVVVVLIGFALPVLAYVRDKDGALRVSAWAGAWLRRFTYVTSSNFERFIVAPVSEIA